MRQLILYAGHVNDPVLIIGATGTGKEVVARQIHQVARGNNDSLKFVAVNCGAIPEDLLESELFGHVKGAFTGAIADKTGLWQEVGKGTLFLDEIGDLCHRHQVKILRALQERKIRKVGSTQDLAVQARIIAASNRDLYTLVQRDDFREDLYYRLRGLLIRTPALRDNVEDIPLLARCFWKKIVDDDQASLPTELLDTLQGYTWPGNARELKTVLSTLHALFGHQALKADHLAWVFYLEGQGALRARQPVSDNAFVLHRAECLRHLKQVEEVIAATRAAVRPLSEGPDAEAETAAAVHNRLRFRLNELDLLCAQPLLFHSDLTFAAINKLKGLLLYFQGLLPVDHAKAREYWHHTVAAEFGLALSVLFKEVSAVLEYRGA